MAYKMKGAPMMANTKSHGTNKNFVKSGMTKDGAPFLGKLAKGAGKLLGGAAKFGAFGPLGMAASALMNKNKGNNNPAQPDNAGTSVPNGAPTSPNMPPPPAAPGAAPVDATQAEQPGMEGAQMGKHLMKGAPMYGKKKGAPKLKGKQHKIDKNKDGKISKSDFDMMNKPGAPGIKDVIKKGVKKAKKVGRKVKNELKAHYEGFKETGGAGSGSDANIRVSNMRYQHGYAQEKRRQKEAREARQRVKEGKGSMKELDSSVQNQKKIDTSKVPNLKKVRRNQAVKNNKKN